MSRLSIILAILFINFFGLPAQAQVKDIRAQVLQINLKSLDDQVLQLKTDGIVINKSSRTIRNIRVNIHLLKKSNNRFKTLRTYTIPSINRLTPQEKRKFTVDWIFKDKTLNSGDLVNIRAVANVKTYSKLPTLQIVDWILEQNWKEISNWKIPISQPQILTQAKRVETASKYLLTIPSSSLDYKEAQRKWNLVQFSYAKQLAEENRYHEAILQFGKVEPDSSYYLLALKHIRNIRPAAMYNQAIKKRQKGDYEKAVLQMSLIPKNDSYYHTLAQKKLKSWREESVYEPWSMNYFHPNQFKNRQNFWESIGVLPDAETSTTHSRYRANTIWYLNYDFFTTDSSGSPLFSQVFSL